MLQALVKRGVVLPADVPAPLVSPGGVLIQVVNSCISAGTELAGVKASGKSLVRRALEQPDKVAKVFKMFRENGLSYTMAKINGHLDAGVPLGYSAAGVVLAVGEGVTDFYPGQRVTAAGAGYANHAQFIDVPRNLVCPMPEGLDFKAASTVTLGSIAMQGVRRAKIELGELVVVVGTGILGLLTVQLLRANGARVIAVDLDERRLALAEKMGAEFIINAKDSSLRDKIFQQTSGRMADCVIFCAATNHSESLSQAFSFLRRKGRLIMVGVWGSELKREDIYAKEIDFHISCSYGPGRYDSSYEEGGHDYPYAYVRWTENRNMLEYLRLLSIGAVNVDLILEKIYPIEKVDEAFAALNGNEKPLLVALDYGPPFSFSEIEKMGSLPRKVSSSLPASTKGAVPLKVAVVGAGDYLTGVHLPNLKKLEPMFALHAVCSRTGSKAQSVANQYQARYSTTDYSEILGDLDVDVVIIATRHNLHGGQVLAALQAGKHVLVEKPLALDAGEVDAIRDFYAAPGDKPMLCVGFNRRFSRYAKAVKEAVGNSPLVLNYRMNAGFLPEEHWVHSHEGGGRIVGEGCHIIDLFRYLAGAPVTSIAVAGMHPQAPYQATDNKIITLEYANGSVGSISYFATGSSEISKEYLEVHWGGKSVIMDNYQELKGYGCSVPAIRDSSPDKGQRDLLEAFGTALLKGGDWPIYLEEILETSYLAIKSQETV